MSAHFRDMKAEARRSGRMSAEKKGALENPYRRLESFIGETLCRVWDSAYTTRLREIEGIKR